MLLTTCNTDYIVEATDNTNHKQIVVGSTTYLEVPDFNIFDEQIPGNQTTYTGWIEEQVRKQNIHARCGYSKLRFVCSEKSIQFENEDDRTLLKLVMMYWLKIKFPENDPTSTLLELHGKK